jgi:hypothetical protein
MHWPLRRRPGRMEMHWPQPPQRRQSRRDSGPNPTPTTPARRRQARGGGASAPRHQLDRLPLARRPTASSSRQAGRQCAHAHHHHLHLSRLQHRRRAEATHARAPPAPPSPKRLPSPPNTRFERGGHSCMNPHRAPSSCSARLRRRRSELPLPEQRGRRRLPASSRLLGWHCAVPRR